MSALAPKRPGFSPLRYPGGKSALFPLVSEIVRLNGASGGTYVEPYAGGAGIALALLLTEQVDLIVINDLDPTIHAFWTAVTQKGPQFCERILSVDLTIGEWRRQRDIYRAADVSDSLALGFATFYLNRTNRSGVLRNGGVIGGQNQTGTYKVDARFNRQALAERCRLIALYASRVTVLACDGADVIAKYSPQPGTLIYADPPYFEKGSQLYLNAFHKADHEGLARTLNENSSAKWLLTYDDCPEISDLYAARRSQRIDAAYSLRSVRRASEFFIVSDTLVLPAAF